MKKFWFVLAMMIGGVFAEPVPVGTKGEVQKAKGLIDDLVASGVDAEKLVSMAAETEKGPERFWLYSNAFILQAKEGKFAEAAETLKTLQQNVTDIPEVNIANLIERNVGKKVAEAPELAAMLKESKARLAAQRLVSKLKKDSRKNPKDAALKASLGEALAVCGDWKAALKAFAESQGTVSGIAKAELEAKRTMKIAAFWWDYQTCRELSSSKAFKTHAVGIYTELLKDDQLSVIEKTLAESRIAQLSEVETANEKEDGLVQRMKMEKKQSVGSLKGNGLRAKAGAHVFEAFLVPCGEADGRVEWKYEMSGEVDDKWNRADFNDSSWASGTTPFGGRPTDSTAWRTSSVCIRKRFDCPYDEEDIKHLQIKFTIDDAMDVWLNGERIWSSGYCPHYETCVLPRTTWKGLLRRTENVLAVSARDFNTGAFLDLGVSAIVRQSVKKELIYQSEYFPVEEKLIFPATKLSEINVCSAVLAGRWVNWNRGTALFAQNIKRVGDSRMTMQFQYVEGGALKGVGVELEQRGRDVRYVHVIYHLTKVKGYTLAGAKQALKDKFSDYEERMILLETLDKTRNFLLSLDKSLAEKQKELKQQL